VEVEDGLGRPKRATVDYFPHRVAHGPTMFVLESRFGNDGYACWFKVLEILGAADGHIYDCTNPAQWEFLLAKTRLDGETAVEILDCLANLGAIDAELWTRRVIWCQSFVDGVKDAYSRRLQDLPTRPTEFLRTETPLTGVSAPGNRERKGKDTKRKDKRSKTPAPTSTSPVDPRVKSLIDAYHDKFLETFGSAPHIVGGKHGKLAKRVLSTVDLPEALVLLDRYLNDQDPFVRKAGYTLEVFENRLQAYRLATNGRSNQIDDDPERF